MKQTFTASIPVNCILDGRCSRDEITITQSAPEQINYISADPPLPVIDTQYTQLYPVCPVVVNMVEAGYETFNVMDTYVYDFVDDSCEFNVFNDNLDLQGVSIPMTITAEPYFGGIGARNDFWINILPQCDPYVEPVSFENYLYSIPLWSPVEVSFDPFFADEACGAT